MDQIERAVEILRAGGLVAFPTETVYGLGADATNQQAVRKIFAAKGRPATNPLIVHVADIATAKKYAAIWPESAQILAEKFWPGPLTLVLPKSPAIVDSVTAGNHDVESYTASADGSKIVALVSTPVNIGDLFVIDLAARLPLAAPRQITRIND